MNFIDKILPENLIYSIGWTIIHSFWQGAVIALLLLTFLTMTKTSSATKTKFSAMAFGLMVISFIVTFSIEMNSYQNPQIVNSSLQTTAISETLSTSSVKSPGINVEENISSEFFVVSELKDFLAHNISLLTFIWFTGFMFFILRFLGGFYLIRKIKYTGTSFVPACWQNRVNSLRYKLRISRSVRLLETAKVSVPIVIGYVKPVILMPVGMLAGLPENQVEAIIAHELAHIYRNDYLINIIQSMGEIILFYHPAAWWISHKIRTERENSCDDIAISVCGDTLTFAKALANLEEVKMKHTQFAIAIKNNKSLIGRIKRILNVDYKEISFAEKTLSFIAIVVLLMSATVLASVSFNPVDKNIINKYVQAAADTSWKKGEYNFVNDNMKVKMKDGKIEKLSINGKKIPSSEFSDYQKMVEDTLQAFNLPGPDIPPVPPVLAVSSDLPEKVPKPIIALTTEIPNMPTEPTLPGDPPKAPKPFITLATNVPEPPPISEAAYFPVVPDIDVDTTGLSLVNEKNFKEQQMKLKKIQETIEYEQQKLKEINEEMLIKKEIDADTTDRSLVREKNFKEQMKLKNIQETIENDQQKLKEINEKMQIREEKAKKKSREFKEQANEIERKSDEFIGNVSNELTGRDIISKGEKFSMKLSRDELIINGKVQPDDLLKIVLTLYKKSWGRELDGDLNYQTDK